MKHVKKHVQIEINGAEKLRSGAQCRDEPPGGGPARQHLLPVAAAVSVLSTDWYMLCASAAMSTDVDCVRNYKRISL